MRLIFRAYDMVTASPITVESAARADRRSIRDAGREDLIGVLRRTLLTACLAMLFGPAVAGAVHSEVPASPDPSAKYLFYMHGLGLETAGPRAQAYDYRGILEALAGRGFEVIGEQRGPVRVDVYAGKVAEQINGLLRAGVPPSRVTVAGHSKGGMITLFVMSMVRNPEVAYVNFAGCGLPGSGFEGFQRFGQTRGPSAKGILLSAYDRGDRIAGSCKVALDRMTGAKVTERVLDLGGGHEAFYTPKAGWLDVLQAWAERRGQ
jgi:predicted esterase